MFALVLAAGFLTSLPDAVSESRKTGKPILVDFHAPWCYSCYYMEQRVLSKPAFEKASERFVPLKLDVDTPEGAALKAKHAVSFLPTYVVLEKGGGPELGRVIGEQTEQEFLAKLKALEKGAATGDAAMQALNERAKKGDLKAVDEALADPHDCRLVYPVLYAEKAAAADKALLSRERAALETLAGKKLFVPPAGRCPDFRSGVEALADVYEAQGDKAARAALMRRAVTQLQSDQSGVGEDRNRDDNLRVFLELAGDDAELDAHYKALLEAYPADYVYAFRWAKRLLARAKPAEALALIEKADKLAYGANRVDVTVARARILAALGRAAEGKKLLERERSAAKARFPDRLAGVEKALAELK